MNTAAFRTDRIHITGHSARALAFLARVEAAKAGVEPQPDGADCLAENIIRAWLDEQPLLEERQAAIRKAFVEIDAAALAKVRTTL